MKVCTECGLPKVRARGLCKKHYEEWLSLNPERAWKKTEYPSDEDLIDLAGECRTMVELARHLGVARESLRDYLKIRPSLNEAVREVIQRNMETSKEGVSRAAQMRWRKTNPEKVREYNRRWARNQDPAQRAKWNAYNRQRRADLDTHLMDDLDLEFAAIVRKDPCGYCNKFDKPTIDHIIPVQSGGTSEWGNLAAACRSCNSSKNDDPLLLFMLRRALDADLTREETTHV